LPVTKGQKIHPACVLSDPTGQNRRGCRIQLRPYRTFRSTGCPGLGSVL